MLMLCRTVVSVAGPAMIADPSLNLDVASFGAIAGWGTAGNLVGKLTNGVLADKLGGSRVFIFSIGLAAVATFIFGTLSSNTAFFALYFLTIFSKSAGWPSMANIIRVTFSNDRHGRIWGFIATSSRISSVATTLLLSSLLLVLSWRGLFFVAAAIALLVAIILPRFLNKNNTSGEELKRTSERELSKQSDLDSNVHPLTDAGTFAAILHFIRSPSFG